MRHGNRTINEAVAAFDLLDALGVQLTPKSDFQGVKHGDETFGRIEALRNKLPDDIVSGLLADELTLERVDNRLLVKEALKPLFDHTGRCIPPQGLAAKVVDANRSFHLIQPKLDYAERLARFEQAFQRQLGISAAEFEDRIARAMWPLAMDPATANLLVHGVYLPIVIPQTEISMTRDYGTVLEQEYITALARAYAAQFAVRTFTNHGARNLAGKVTVIQQSHQRLLDAIYRRPAVGLYFPNALQGFSSPADREVMAYLPQDFLLAGAIDTAAALVGYPDVLARDWNTLELDCVAVQWQSREQSLYFKAYDDGLDLDFRHLDVLALYSGGLLVLG